MKTIKKFMIFLATLCIFLTSATTAFAVQDYRDSLFCWKETYGRGAGTIPTYTPSCPSGSFYDPAGNCYTCPSGKIRTLFYPVTHPTMACGNVFVGYSAATKVQETNVCGEGNTLNAGLCYPECKQGYNGIGPVCWATCPATHPVACGMGCSVSQLFCDEAVTQQVLSVLETGLAVAGTVASGGAGVALGLVSNGGGVLHGAIDTEFARTADGYVNLSENLTEEAIKDALLTTARDGNIAFEEDTAAALAAWLVRARGEASQDQAASTIYNLGNTMLGQGQSMADLLNATKGITNKVNMGVAATAMSVKGVVGAYYKPICWEEQQYTPFTIASGYLNWRDGGEHALDVATDRHGRPWIIKAAKYYPGSKTYTSVGIYYKEGTTWHRVEPRWPYSPETLSRIDVGRDNDPWVITILGQVFHLDPVTKEWEQVIFNDMMSAMDVSVDKSGISESEYGDMFDQFNDVYIISTNQGANSSKGNDVYATEWLGGPDSRGWRRLDKQSISLGYNKGEMVNMSVDRAGRVQYVTPYTNGVWYTEKLSDTTARAIAVTANEKVVLDTNGKVYYRGNSDTWFKDEHWNPVDKGEASQVAISGANNFWVIGGDNRLYQGSKTDNWLTPSTLGQSTAVSYGAGYVVDDDNDGVPNQDDNCPTNANPDQADIDGDGIGDVCDSDNDNDGVLNGSDNCPVDANPSQDNNDGDLQGDVCDADDDNDSILDAAPDNCPFSPNTDQSDFDNDGAGDVCDDDADGDSVSNSLDNCPANPNPLQEDTDGDGAGDACDSDDDNDGVNDLDATGQALDNCPLTPNPNQADNDGDNVGDVCDTDDDNDGVADAYPDNCPFIANSGQENTDGDTLGDACDPDIDNDGVNNDFDNCPLASNPDQANTDGVGAGDACNSASDQDGDNWEDGYDNCPAIANGNQTDFDQDGLGDACDPDSDNDGVANASDVCMNTTPGEVVNSTGCTIAQLCPCNAPRQSTTGWRNHGKYVSCVTQSANSFYKENVISNDMNGSITSEAANSTCGAK